MKLLFVTQKVDASDDVLGIYHEWIKQLALEEEIAMLSVICLFEGKHALPEDVRVHSLGKERGVPSFLSRIRYALRFYKQLWKLRGVYDAVFVHMNKEYVLLAGPLWKLLGVPVVFWYNHPRGGWAVRAAASLVDTILYTSPAAFTARYTKSERMPVGVVVPEEVPLPHPRHEPLSVISVGRLSPVKNVDVMVDAVAQLQAEKVPVVLDLYGAPVARAEDTEYSKVLERRVERSNRTVRIHPPVPNPEVRSLFQAADLSLNLTTTGSMDKTIFESIAAGCPVVTSNQALRSDLPERWRETLVCRERDAADCASKIARVQALQDSEYEAMRRDLFLWVKTEHSLDRLVPRIVGVFRRLLTKD